MRRGTTVLLLSAVAAAATVSPAWAQLPLLPTAPTSSTTTTTAAPPTTTTAPPASTTSRPRRTTTTAAARTSTSTSSTTTTTITSSAPGATVIPFEIETLEAVERRDAVEVRTTIRNPGDQPLAASGHVHLVGAADQRVAGPRPLAVAPIAPGGKGRASARVRSSGSDPVGVVLTLRAGGTTKVARTDLAVPAVTDEGTTDTRRGTFLLIGAALAAAVFAVLRARRPDATDEASPS